MKLSTISDTLNIHMSVEFLTNAILAGDAWLTINTEMGDIAVEISDRRVHDARDGNFGVKVCRLKEASGSTFVNELMRGDQRENIRWYINIPYVEGQSKDFTKILVARALSTCFLFEAVEDTHVTSHLISSEEMDMAFVAYWDNYEDEGVNGYQPFNRELIKLSVPPMQRHGQNYRNLIIANREALRLRIARAKSKLFQNDVSFTGMYDIGSKLTFGGKFYRSIFTIILGEINYRSFGQDPATAYSDILSPRIRKGHPVLPIVLIKLCLIPNSKRSDRKIETGIKEDK